MFVDEKVIDFFNNEMVLAKFNAEVDTLLARSYHVSAFPTMVMVDKDGNEIDRVVGYLDSEKLIQKLRDYTRGIGTLDDLLDQARVTADSLRKLGFEIADKYKYRGGNDEAGKWFEKIIQLGDPVDSLSGEARMAIADMYRRDKDYMMALVAFASIMQDFEGKPFAMDAEIWTAIVYRMRGDTATAIGAFEDYIKHFPESEDVEYAQKQIDRLKNPPEKKP